MPTPKNTFWNDVVFPLNEIIDLRGTIGVHIPDGSTAQRPVTPQSGDFRFNRDSYTMEYYVDDGTNQLWETITTTGISGEANTVKDVGTGQPIFKQKVGSELQFKSIKAGSNIAIQNSGDELIISSASPVGQNNIGVNIGAGREIYAGKDGVALRLKTLESINANLSITDNGDRLTFEFTAGGGTINEGRNLGSGVGVYQSYTGSIMDFNSLVGDVSTSGALSITTPVVGEIKLGIHDNPIFTGTGAIRLPIGNTFQRPTVADGAIRFNTDISGVEAIIGGTWVALGGGGGSAGDFVQKIGDTMTGDLVLDDGSNPVSLLINNGSLLITGGNINVDGLVDGVDVGNIGTVVTNIDEDTEAGFIVKLDIGVSASTYARRSISGDSSISVINGDGIASNPVMFIPDNATINGSGAISIPRGDTVGRPVATPSGGQIRVNTDPTLDAFEYSANGKWYSALSANAAGEVTNDITLSAGANIVMTNIGGNNLVDGIDISDLANTVAGLIPLTGQGFQASIADGTTEFRTLLEGAGINIINADGTNDAIGGGTTGADPILSVDITNTPTYTIGSPAAPNVAGNDELLIWDIDDKNDGSGFSGMRKITVSDLQGAANILADENPELLGINVNSGTSPALIGLDIGSLDNVAPREVDFIPKFFPDTGGLNTPPKANERSTIGDMFGLFEDNRLVLTKASSDTVTPVPISGTTAINFPIVILDTSTSWTGSPADTYTPPAGWYEVKVYVRFDQVAGAVVGRHDVDFLVDGVQTGNVLTVDVITGNQSTAIMDDIFEATGTTTFGIQITGPSGSQVEEVRFYAKRLRS